MPGLARHRRRAGGTLELFASWHGSDWWFSSRTRIACSAFYKDCAPRPPAGFFKELTFSRLPSSRILGFANSLVPARSITTSCILILALARAHEKRRGYKHVFDWVSDAENSHRGTRCRLAPSFTKGSAWPDLFQVLARPLVPPPGLSRYPWVQVQLAARCSKARKVRNFPSHATEGNAQLTMWGRSIDPGAKNEKHIPGAKSRD